MIARHSLAFASLTVIGVFCLASPAAAQAVSDEAPQTPSWAGSDIIVTGQRQTYDEPDVVH